MTPKNLWSPATLLGDKSPVTFSSCCSIGPVIAQVMPESFSLFVQWAQHSGLNLTISMDILILYSWVSSFTESLWKIKSNAQELKVPLLCPMKFHSCLPEMDIIRIRISLLLLMLATPSASCQKFAWIKFLIMAFRIVTKTLKNTPPKHQKKQLSQKLRFLTSILFSSASILSYQNWTFTTVYRYSWGRRT